MPIILPPRYTPEDRAIIAAAITYNFLLWIMWPSMGAWTSLILLAAVITHFILIGESGQKLLEQLY